MLAGARPRQQQHQGVVATQGPPSTGCCRSSCTRAGTLAAAAAQQCLPHCLQLSRTCSLCLSQQRRRRQQQHQHRRCWGVLLVWQQTAWLWMHTRLQACMQLGQAVTCSFDDSCSVCLHCLVCLSNALCAACRGHCAVGWLCRRDSKHNVWGVFVGMSWRGSGPAAGSSTGKECSW